MATTVLPLRQNTGSTGTTTSSSSQRYGRRLSMTSVPSQASGSEVTRNESALSAQTANTRFASTVLSRDDVQNRGHRQTSSGGRRTKSPTSRLVKSQYPPDSTEKHVEYILVASFDIDRGSVMEHQYPGPVGGDEHMLAELMLPDQAHTRAQDWTIFFLHKDAGADEEEQTSKGQRQRRRRRRRKIPQTSGAESDAGTGNESEDSSGFTGQSESGDDSDGLEAGDSYLEGDDDDSADGPPLVYVLNLVNTKHDTTTRRGAVCKAMAICTRHSFLHIYKPLLLLALEQYFASPTLNTLARLYDAVNSMDLSLMPRLTMYERYLLQGVDAKDLFVEKFEAIVAQRLLTTGSEPGSTGATPSSPTAAHNPFGARYGLPRDTHEFESVVKYANVPVPVKIPTAVFTETVGDFSLIKLITTFSTPHATSPQPFAPLHPHLTTGGAYTHPVMVLMNALLTQKRIIFLGHNLPSSDVAEAVLAACALASGGLLRGFTRHAFPYTDLTKIEDLLKVPGFIAGVTNPAFAHHSEWWDLLCDVSTGRIKISPKIEAAAPSEGVAFFQKDLAAHGSGGGGFASFAGAAGNSGSGSSSADATGDGAFMASVLTAIHDRRGENAVRQKFRLWVHKFTRLSAAFEESVYGASALHVHPSDISPKPPFSGAEFDSMTGTTLSGQSSGAGSQRTTIAALGGVQMPSEVQGHGYVWPSAQSRVLELAANATRIEGWRNTRSYYSLIQDLAVAFTNRPIKGIDPQHLHDRLAKLRLHPTQAADIYLAICASVYSDQQICQLLAVVVHGSSDGAVAGTAQGLFYIALGLFHPRLDVRQAVAELLLRIQEHEAGRLFWASLGGFAKAAWGRIMAAREARLDRDGDD